MTQNEPLPYTIDARLYISVRPLIPICKRGVAYKRRNASCQKQTNQQCKKDPTHNPRVTNDFEMFQEKLERAKNKRAPAKFAGPGWI
jgi:hypothetical protein